jgi:hypothetical protein
MTYTFSALAAARLPAEVYLLAIGNLIVHLLTVSFPYVSPSCHTGAAYIDKERGDVSGSFIIPYVPKNFMINNSSIDKDCSALPSSHSFY